MRDYNYVAVESGTLILNIWFFYHDNENRGEREFNVRKGDCGRAGVNKQNTQSPDTFEHGGEEGDEEREAEARSRRNTI